MVINLLGEVLVGFHQMMQRRYKKKLKRFKTRPEENNSVF